MKKLKSFGVIGFCFIVLLIFTEPAQSQCPMCKAAVESTVKGGQSNAGRGLNDGILYLLAAPYLVVAGLGILWYKKYRVKAKVDVPEEKINLN